MVRTSGSYRRIVERTGLCLGESDQVLEGSRRYGRMQRQENGGMRSIGDRRQILDWVIGHVAIQVLVYRDLRSRAEQDGISVGWRFGDRLRAYHAACSRPILHHHLLSETVFILQLLRNHTHEDVQTATGRKRHDYA